MDVFALRARLIAEYRDYFTSFVEIADERTKERVTQALNEGARWPEPLIHLNQMLEWGRLYCRRRVASLFLGRRESR